MKGKDVNWQHPMCQFLSLGRYFIFICHLFLIKMRKTIHDTILLALLAAPPRDPCLRPYTGLCILLLWERHSVRLSKLLSVFFQSSVI